MYRLIAFLILFSIAVSTYSQSADINEDSLMKVTFSMKEDSNKANNLLKLAALFRNYGVVDSSIMFANQALIISNKLKLTSQKVEAIYNTSLAYSYINRKDTSIYLLLQADKFIANDTSAMAMKWKSVIYNSLGIFYMETDKNENAIKYHLKSLNIKEKIGNKKGMVYSYNNIGNVYMYISNFEQALSYYEKSLIIAKEIGFDMHFHTVYMNLGNVNFKLKRLDKALEYWKINYSVLKLSNEPYSLAKCYTNLGSLYFTINQLDSAKYYFNNSLKLRLELNDVDFLFSSYLNLAQVYAKLKDIKKTEEMLEMAFQNVKMQNKVYNYKEYYGYASEIYALINNKDKEIFNLKKYIYYIDSLSIIENSKIVAELSTKYDTEKKDAAIKLLNKDKEIAETNLEKRLFERNVFIIGIILLLFISGFIYNRFKITQKQKEIISLKELETQKQKRLVEHKNFEITQSIQYAQKIQSALLPNEEVFKASLADSFIIFKPKDIVSGDFYWLSDKEDCVYYATADSTGHGVPGGFMSMLGTALLNEIIDERKITDCGEVLTLMREKIIQALKQTGNSESKDGMDMVLIRIDKKSLKMQYAAANNSFYIVKRHETGDLRQEGSSLKSRISNLEELPCDKMPVGVYHSEVKPFQTFTHQLSVGDIIYTYTDGYADQFGGEKGKKYTYKRLREKLVAISEKTLTEQRIILESEFENWKGKNEQIDDICLIGVKV